MPLKIYHRHCWDLSHEEAVKIQKTLGSRVSIQPLREPVRLVAGTDVSYSKNTDRAFAAVVVVDVKTMETIETVTAEGRAGFTYLPGLLSFREVPILLEAAEKLASHPDVLILDGQGIAHPQGLGLASHFGLCIDLPTVGCAKSRLIGDYEPIPKKRGASSYLYWRGKTVGVVLCTKDGIKPVFVSPGNRIDMQSSVDIVLRSCHGYKLPEPVRKAHAVATRLRIEAEA